MKRVITETVRFDKLVPGGQAMGKMADGRKLFAWGVLSGELATVQVTKLKKSYAEAVATDIIEVSPERVAPRDNCYLSTSPWQIMTEIAEVKHKSELVVDAFRQENIELPSVEIKGNGNFWHYRNKMEYSLWYDHDTAQIYPAFHQRGSYQKIVAKSSSIERPEIWMEIERIVAELNDNGDEARRYQSIMIRCNQAGEVRSVLYEMNQPHPAAPPLSDTICEHKYTYSPNGFFQINLPVYELALNEIKQFINTDKVVDMYSGVGTIGLSTASDKELTLVETDNYAYAELEHNIPAGSCNIKGVHAKSEEALEYITNDATIIVDPPRAGLDAKVVGQLLKALPPQIIYLSCNPATQARDVKLLVEKYKIVHNQPFNFFPRTPHIENLIVLSR